jgi:hypothetical protein|tara:strand:+ start:576 stop:740 length:165 start_codon:yes stop_codon:yes gene_type:complete
MIDNFFYKLCGLVDDFFSAIETYAIKFTSWLWETRVKILRKKQKNARHKTSRRV